MRKRLERWEQHVMPLPSCCSLQIAVYPCAVETVVQPTFNVLYLDPAPGTPCFIHILTLLNSLKTTSSKNHLKEITSVYYTMSSEKRPT